jgi:hypothetical protein
MYKSKHIEKGVSIGFSAYYLPMYSGISKDYVQLTY